MLELSKGRWICVKCLFIINPVSGTKVIQKNLDRIIGTLILDTDVSTVDTFYTENKNDAMYKAASLKAGDYDFIVSVGGDGTVNEVLMGLINSNSHIPVALIPAGTVNDFANYLKLPTTPHDFAKMIKNFKTIKADVGQEAHSDICFANVLSGGMFSDIAFMVTKELKNTFGPLAYYVTGIKELPAQLAMNLHLKVTADHEYFEEDASLFLITNSSSVGGFRDITPYADVSDGKLDLFIIKKCNVAELLNLLKDYRFQIHTKNPMIRYCQASHIKIECDQDIVYDIDGEKGEGFPIEVNCLAGLIDLIVPEK